MKDQTCSRVVLCQMKNGLPSALAFFMKPMVFSTLADVLVYPKGNFAVLAHEAQQIAAGS
jgi:hypothetical protein